VAAIKSTTQNTQHDVVGNWLLLYVYLQRNNMKKKSFRPRRTEEGRKRRQRNLPRPSFLLPTASPWQQLYESKDDAALITVTGFDYNAFNAMHDMFQPLFEQFSPWTKNNPCWNYKEVDMEQNRGSPQTISSIQCLGLVLAWF
jgi:hypothetical protein